MTLLPEPFDRDDTTLRHIDIIPRSMCTHSAARGSHVTSEQQSHSNKHEADGMGRTTVQDNDADPVAPQAVTADDLDRGASQSPETEIPGDDEPFVAGGDESASDEAPADPVGTIIQERDDYLDQLQRSRAEFANFRRRNDQERAMLRQLVSRDVLAQFLPVIDDLDRALATIPEQERGSGWVKGVTLIQSKLNGTVERLGVTKIDAVGKPFDPALHEAVSTEPGSSGSTVVEVYQSGYQLGDMLVRPAMVKTGDANAAGVNQVTDTPEDQETSFNA